MLVGFPAGSAPDIMARLAAQWLSERLGQQFVVENRPGAGSNIATEVVVKADPDGYTILADVLSNVLNVSLYQNLNFNFIRDIAPISTTAMRRTSCWSRTHSRPQPSLSSLPTRR
jgi:tripartite-type tricarboxylate transporter receptor subunit TctC